LTLLLKRLLNGWKIDKKDQIQDFVFLTKNLCIAAGFYRLLV